MINIGVHFTEWPFANSLSVDLRFLGVQWTWHCVWYGDLSVPGDEDLPVEWALEDPYFEGEDKESGGSVHPLQLDQLPVGLLGLLQEICLCLWSHSAGKPHPHTLHIK